MEGILYNRKSSGLTLVEVLVGTSLLLLVFVGIFGLIQLTLKLVAQSKARVTATALANQKIELARNLSYNQIGTVGGIPAGSIPENETLTRNGVAYNVKTTVTYVDDLFDNSFPDDPLPWDYKKIKVAVSWAGFMGGTVYLLSDVAPKGVETTGGGGIISILVFDANGQPVPQASLHVENNVVTPAIDATYQTNDQGRLFLPGAPACNDCYKITATKSGYSIERTYAVGETIRGTALATPSKPYVSVIEGQQSEISFSIDRLSTKTVQSVKYVEEKTWNDSFDDLTKIDETFQTVASTTEGTVKLVQAEGQYLSFGYLISAAITPTSLVEWGRLNWSEDKPISTEIKYHLLYSTSSSWELIPDADLTIAGVTNSEGFTSAPLDLIDLDPLKYPSVKIKADFSTTDASSTPTLFDWQITWFSSGVATPIGNLAFAMQGAKTLGTDEGGEPIYKYRENLSTDSGGQKTIADLEWDSYKITVNGASTGYDIANSSPSQPVNVNPDTNQTTILRLANHQSNTLLATVKDSAGFPLVGANVRLHKTGYDKLKLTTDSGQAFFSPLTYGTSTLDVKMTGFQDWSEDIGISGQTEKIIILTPP